MNRGTEPSSHIRYDGTILEDWRTYEILFLLIFYACITVFCSVLNYLYPIEFVHRDAISTDLCPLLLAAYLFCLDSVFRFYLNTGNSSARLVFPSHIHRCGDKGLPSPPLASAPYEYSNVNNSYLCSTGPKIDQRASEYQIEAKSPLKISSILFTSQRWQWPAKRLHFHALCKANSYFIQAAYFVWGGGCVAFPV